MLDQGRIPIYEPGLAELVLRKRRPAACTSPPTCPTPSPTRRSCSSPWARRRPTTGARDLSALWKVVDGLAPHLAPNAIVVIKSTVPVGTNAAVYARLNELTGRDCDVASNPEFLKEGAAIDDFMKPDRVVVGVRGREVGRGAPRAVQPVPADRAGRSW